MCDYPDMWVVTDSKSSNAEKVKMFFEILVETAEKLDKEEILDRIIVQIYQEEMYEVVNQIYPFESYIFTLYHHELMGNSEKIRGFVRFCYAKGIDALTVEKFKVTSEFLSIADDYSIPVYAHTENEAHKAKELLDMGIAGVYTDILTEKDIYWEE